MDTQQPPNIIVGISSCLMGEPVHPNADQKKNPFIHDVLPRCFQLEFSSADRQADWYQALNGYIFTKDASTLMKNFPFLPIEEESRLNDVHVQENFVQHVYVYTRWKALCASGITLAKLQQFHASHKYLLMSHNSLMTKNLGGIVAKATKADLQQSADTYIKKMTEILKIVATRKGHTNTLQHLQGYLKNTLSAEDKQELTNSIHLYRMGDLPLIAPLTLLRHHFQRSPHDYISQSHYMQPHPNELKLLNQL